MPDVGRDVTHDPQEPRMLPPARLRNQFDTSGRALAQYLPDLKSVMRHQRHDRLAFWRAVTRNRVYEVCGDFFGIVETLAH